MAHSRWLVVHGWVTRTLRFARTHTLALSVPVLSILYGLGDHYAWWDRLRGRTHLAHALERLADPKYFPTSFVYQGDEDFDRLEAFLTAHSTNPVVEARSLGSGPTLIVRVGAADRAIPGPPGWPRFVTVASDAPIVYFYDAAPKQLGKDHAWVGTLAEARSWIDEGRNWERMLVGVVLINVLTLALLVHESKATRD